MTSRKRTEADSVHRRILSAFTEKARVNGPRSVVMAELARELGISTRTLYKHFATKADLVGEVMDGFAREVERRQQSRFERKLSPVERIRETANGWLETRTRFSPVFWSEVAAHYPAAQELWVAQQRRSWAHARERIVPDLRGDAPPDLVISLLMASLRHAADPERCDRLGLSRQEAVAHAVDTWARGALARPRLSLVPPLREDSG